MRSRIAILALTFPLLLAGCGGSHQSSQPTATTDSALLEQRMKAMQSDLEQMRLQQEQMKQQQEQQKQAEQQKEKEQEQQAQAREMTPEQAKQLMDREKVDEMLLPASHREKPHNSEHPLKDW